MSHEVSSELRGESASKAFFLIVLIVWIRIHKTAEFGSIGIRSITLILVTSQLARKLLHIFYLHNMPNDKEVTFPNNQ